MYDVASVTKIFPALLALHCIDNGLLSLDDTVVSFVPEITVPNAELACIRHLLTYTYVLERSTNAVPYERASAADVFDFMYGRQLAAVPGTTYEYANTCANILGVVLERVLQRNLYEAIEELILRPLGMKDSTFAPTDKSLVPPTEIVPWRGTIQGVVHDEQSFIFQRDGFNPGCAGLFSTAGDILQVVEMILRGGVRNGIRILKEDSVALMKQNAIRDINGCASLGWDVHRPKYMGAMSSEHMIGKTGFTGACCVVDTQTGYSFVLLSNRTFPVRPKDSEAIDRVRRSIADIVFKRDASILYV